MTEIISKAYAHVKKEYPYECCGILLGKSTKGADPVITDYVPADNEDLTGNRSKHFYIDPLKFYEKEKKYSEQGLDIIGIVHSHPDAEARPSSYDPRPSVPDHRSQEGRKHRPQILEKRPDDNEGFRSFEKF